MFVCFQWPQHPQIIQVLDVALGLEYLHSFNPPIIHGDLKGVSVFYLIIHGLILNCFQTNIVITPSLRACVTDFGLCTLVHDSKVQFTPTSSGYPCGTMRWQAPELLRYQESGQKSERKSLASDIYSFGCVCYEVGFIDSTPRSVISHIAPDFRGKPTVL